MVAVICESILTPVIDWRRSKNVCLLSQCRLQIRSSKFSPSWALTNWKTDILMKSLILRFGKFHPSTQTLNRQCALNKNCRSFERLVVVGRIQLRRLCIAKKSFKVIDSSKCRIFTQKRWKFPEIVKIERELVKKSLRSISGFLIVYALK